MLKLNNAPVWFELCGLTFRSPLMLPGGVETDPPADGHADVEIAAGPVSTQFPQGGRYASEYLIHGSDVILHIPRIGRFRITDGRAITVDAQTNVDRRDLVTYLKGSVLAVLLHQRKTMPLHAACVARNGNALAFLGTSAAGKSTMAAAFTRHGFELICDDVLVHRKDDDGIVVLPSDNSTKLWPDSVSALDLAGGAQADRPPGDKHAMPAAAAKRNRVHRLRGIFVLSWLYPVTAAPEIKAAPEITAFSLLRKNIYRDQLVAALDLEGQYMSTIAKLIGTVPVFSLARPADLSVIGAIPDLVAESLGV